MARKGGFPRTLRPLTDTGTLPRATSAGARLGKGSPAGRRDAESARVDESGKRATTLDYYVHNGGQCVCVRVKRKRNARRRWHVSLRSARCKGVGRLLGSIGEMEAQADPLCDNTT